MNDLDATRPATNGFGAFLRQQRERHEAPLSEIARKTKISLTCLENLEAGKLEGLPAEVFVRGFIRSYARALGIGHDEALGLFEAELNARRKLEESASTVPVAPDSVPGVALGPAGDDERPHRSGIGLAVLVVFVLLIATITLSLYLRQPPQSGEGLSDAGRGDSVAASLWLG